MVHKGGGSWYETGTKLVPGQFATGWVLVSEGPWLDEHTELMVNRWSSPVH